jgi:hypothetical protein
MTTGSAVPTDFPSVEIFNRLGHLYVKSVLYLVSGAVFSALGYISYTAADRQNSIWTLLFPVAVFFFYILAKAIREIIWKKPQIRIDHEGIHLLLPSDEVYPWALLSEAATVETLIVVKLFPDDGQTSGRSLPEEIFISARSYDFKLAEIVALISDGIERFSKPRA